MKAKDLTIKQIEEKLAELNKTYDSYSTTLFTPRLRS